MKKIAILFISCFVLAGVFMLDSCQSTKSSTASKMLKFNFEKGKGYDYELTSNMDQEGMGMTMGVDLTAYYSMIVDDDNGTEKTITSTFSRVKVNMGVGPIKIDVDTDKPYEASGDTTNDINKAMGMFNKLFGSIKGKQFKMRVNAEGKVLEVTGFKEMAESIVNSIGSDLPVQEKEQMRQQFGKQFNDEGVKGQFERVLYIFPNKEVKIGESWDRSTTVEEGGMPISYNSTYKVTEIEGDMVTLEEKSVLKSAKEGVDMNGKGEGIIVVDSRNGLIVSSNSDMKMTVTAGGKSAEIKSKTRIKGKAL